MGFGLAYYIYRATQYICVPLYSPCALKELFLRHFYIEANLILDIAMQIMYNIKWRLLIVTEINRTN